MRYSPAKAGDFYWRRDPRGWPWPLKVVSEYGIFVWIAYLLIHGPESLVP
jgi:hypothetical protein